MVRAVGRPGQRPGGGSGDTAPVASFSKGDHASSGKRESQQHFARCPQIAHGAAAPLSESFPSRFVFGLGVVYPDHAASVGREFGNPVASIRDNR